jgi:predicted RND superfamily exporter protein
MDGWNALSPFLILAVGAGHAVQILKRYYEEYRRLGDNRAAVIESTVNVGIVMITAGLIAATGLFTLTLFPIRSIQVFGLLSGSGILSALVIEMSFIPACRTLLPAPKQKEMLAEKHGGVLEIVLEKMARTINARPWLSLVVGVVVLVTAILGAPRIQVDNSFRQALPKNEHTVTEYYRLNELFGGVITFNVLVEAKEPDALHDPALLRAIEGMQQFLVAKPEVGRTLSIVDYIKQMNVAFNDGNEDFRRLPDSREAVAQYFLLYSGDPDDFNMLVDSDYRIAVIRAFAEFDNATLCERLFRESRAYAAEHFPPDVRVGVAGGGMAIGKALNDVVIREKVRNAAVIVSIIFLVSSLVLRSFVGGLLVLTPSVLAAIVNLGIMGLIGSWLNLATASISSLTVSIGADYAIYFIFRFREEYSRCHDVREATLTTMLTSGKAVFFVATAIASGSLVIAFSPLAYHRQLGGYVAASMFTASLAAVTIIPSVVILLKPKFLRREKVRDPRPSAPAAPGPQPPVADPPLLRPQPPHIREVP